MAIISEGNYCRSTPDNKSGSSAKKQIKNMGFGFYQKSMSDLNGFTDTLAWQVLDAKVIGKLTQHDLANRLRTTYQRLHQGCKKLNVQTKASTTLYDGRDNLITATLGDTPGQEHQSLNS